MITKVSTKVYLRANKVKGKLLPIYIRIIYKRQKAEISTGLRIPEKEWDDSIQRAKNNAAYNTTINNLLNGVYSAINFLSKEKRPINAKILKDIIKNDEADSFGILEYFQKHIDQVILANEIKVDSRRRYEDTYDHLVEFLQKIKTHYNDLPLDLVNHSLLTEFDLFLRSKQTRQKFVHRFLLSR